MPPVVALRQGLLSNLANPKMAVFFTSLLPQFAPEGDGAFAAMLALGLLFCSLTFAWLALYSVAVARARDLLGRTGCAARSRASPAPCSSRSGSGSPPTRADVARVLLAYSNFARFVRIDRDLLAERHEVEEYAQPGVVPRPLEVVRKVRRADVLVVWFASWHALLPLLARAPSAQAVAADRRRLRHGLDAGDRLRLPAGRDPPPARARLHAARDAADDELGVQPRRAPAHRRLRGRASSTTACRIRSASCRQGRRDRVAVTVSNVARIALERKGLRPFVEAGAHVPDVELAARRRVDGRRARTSSARAAAPNVRLTGRLSDEELDALLRRAAVYVQASRHEGFGMGVAEAMLAGCIPVVTAPARCRRSSGTSASSWSAEPEAVADGIRRALELGPEARAAARERIVSRFPLELRREGLLGLVDELLR